MVVDGNGAEPFLQLPQGVGAFGQRVPSPVDPRALLHHLLHLVEEFRDRLPAIGLVEQITLEPPLLVASLCLYRGSWFWRRAGVPGGGPAGAGPQDQAFGQRVGPQPVGSR